ncbi:MAG: hypothetical protein GF344_03725 [Chitinivibrionales bacterium]|nr:hypothetical protein [Chitinivibrionales bacterium]
MLRELTDRGLIDVFCLTPKHFNHPNPRVRESAQRIMPEWRLRPSYKAQERAKAEKLQEELAKLKRANHCGVTLGVGNRLVEIENRRCRGNKSGNKEYWAREIVLSDQLVSFDNEFITYKPSGDGLFSGCPVITAEDFYPEEVAANQVGKAVDDYILNTRKEAAKFLTGLIPTWGAVTSGVVDLLFGFMKDKKWSGSQAVGSLNSIVSTFVSEYLGKKNASETIKNFTGKCLSSTAAAASAVAFIAAIEKEKKNLDDKVTLATNPILQGEKFGDSQAVFDSIYLLSVTETKRCIENGAFSIKTTDNTAMFFMNRQVDRITNQQEFSRFQYQFSPTGGFLEREDYSASDSLFCGNILNDFYAKLKAFKEKFSNEMKVLSGGNMKAGDFSKLIVKQNVLKQVFSNKDLNPALVDYVGGDRIPKLVDAYMINQRDFASDEERIEFEAFRRLMGYLSAMYPRCPVCNSAVSMSWGWCPYHGTNDIAMLIDRANEGEVGSLNDEFLEKFGDMTIRDLVENPLYNSKGFLVHWTEFLLV